MNSGRPSFYRLLHRGRYHPAKATALGATKEGRLERERFAASAISFCLKHDEQFRAHFWKSVCRPEGSTEKAPTLRPEDVWLEPPLWADLCLQYADEGRRQTWIVIEIKTGASLKAKQNPREEKAFFALGKGYGALFLKQKIAGTARRRYVILGAQEELGIRDGDSLREIEIQERSWHQLLAGRPRTTLTNDLVDSLGKLHIDAFMMEEAKLIELTGGLTNVGKAGQVLEAVCQWLGVTATTQKQYEAYSNGDDDVFGIYLKRPSKRAKVSALYVKLCALAGRESDVVWFGYMTDGEKPVKKSVFFYCKDAATQNRLAAKFKEAPNQPETGRDGDIFFVNMECPPETARGKDFDWFTSVFEQAAKAGKRPG